MRMLIWYITLVGWVVSACDYGGPICPQSQKTIQWTCPAEQVRVVRAFWGRDAGDNSTCLQGVPRDNHRTEECPGDEQKALAAVSSWCDANVTPDGKCVFTVPTQKLQIDGEELYDPCPGTQKYFRLCSSCECPQPTGVKHIKYYNVPYTVSAIEETSTGDLAMVDFYGGRAGIFSIDIVLMRELILTDAGRLGDVARDKDILFITDFTNNVIHVINENGVYIKRMDTWITGVRRLVVIGNTIWLLARETGVHKLTIDAAYNIVDSILLVANDQQFHHPTAISVLPSYFVVLCRFASNTHYFHHNGTAMFPPVDYVGGDGTNLEMDSCQNAYIIYKHSERLSLFLKDGTNFTEVTYNITLSNLGIYWRDRFLYVSEFTIENPEQAPRVARIQFFWNY